MTNDRNRIASVKVKQINITANTLSGKLLEPIDIDLECGNFETLTLK